ncbi:MAG: extracellular solute-binding protein [Clostridium sp.]|uniref:extracellular solute-binding protein n=1 Tax=Clostridium sp. TaxID=1506 RepID=UPI003D6CDFF3
MKKGLLSKSLLVSLALALSLGTIVTGCKKKVDSTKPADVTQTSALKDFKNTELTWYINYDWAGDTGWGTDTTTKYLLDTYGIKVKWVTSNGASKQKLATMIASSELPDIITLERGADTNQLVSAGVLHPIDDYVKKYPNLMKWSTPKGLKVLASPVDDKLYGVPNWYTNEKHPLGNSGFVLNEKYYKELGQPKINNLDDFYSYLKSIKAKYPDVIPMSFGAGLTGGDVFYSLFAEKRDKEAAKSFFYKSGNELKSVFQDPAYQEYLLYVNKLYREGLMSSEDFTMKQEQWAQKANNGKIGAFAADDALGGTQEIDQAYRKNDPQGGYAQIEPPAKAGIDKSKVTPSAYSSAGWNHTVITNSAKDPEKIYALLDWLTGPDGQMISNYGPKGLYWDETVDYEGTKVPVLTDKWRNKVDYSEIGEINWVANGAWNAVASAYDNEKNPPKAGTWDVAKETKISQKFSYNTDEYLNITPDPTSQEGIIYQSVKDELTKDIAKVVLSKTEADAKKEIESADANATKLGFDKVLKVMTDSWQKNLNTK